MSLPAMPGHAEARGEFFGPVFLRIGVMELIAYLLASVGLTVLIIWPEGGPGAFFREKILRRVLPRSFVGVLDCYICSGFWAGLILSVPWWFLCRRPWVWFGCLMVPAVFWLVMGKWKN